MTIKLTKSQRRILDSHHTATLSRRDLLGLGLTSSVGAFFANSFASQLALGSPFRTDLPAYFTIDLVGGAAISGNFVMGGAGGSTDLLPSYSYLGFNPATATLDNRFGIVSPANVSQMFIGMTSRMSAEAQKLTRITSMAHLGVDDTDVNSHSAIGLIARYFQQEIPTTRRGLSRLGTASGGNARTVVDIPSLRPEAINNAEQLLTLGGFAELEAIGVKGNLLKNLILSQKQEYLTKFMQMTSAQQIELKESFEKIMDSYEQNLSTPSLDPRLQAAVAKLFNINQNSSPNIEPVIVAAIAYCHLLGVVGPSCIALGSCDYHDGTQTTGDNRDLAIGQYIGAIVELAHVLKRGVFIQVITDGGVAPSTPGTRIWSGDSGIRSASLMINYSPSGSVTQVKNQLGHYTSGQIAEVSTFIGNSTKNVAFATFLNFLSVNKDLAKLRDYLSEGELPSSQIDKLLAFTA